MPNCGALQSPAASARRGGRKPSSHTGRSHSSKTGQAWAKRTEDGYANFKCPICGEAVRFHRIRGNLEPQIECSNPLCRWVLDELVRENKIPELAQKPKGVSSRQWFQSKAAAGGT